MKEKIFTHIFVLLFIVLIVLFNSRGKTANMMLFDFISLYIIYLVVNGCVRITMGITKYFSGKR